LVACKEVVYDSTNSNNLLYIDQSYYIAGPIGCTPEHGVQNLSNNTQAQRNQYGLKHYVAGTIHSVMGDTLMHITMIAILKNLSDFNLCGKGQLIVILS
jgi:hypothetical protein